MYRIYSVSPGQMIHGEFSGFNPLTNNYGYNITECDTIPQPHIAPGQPETNAVPYGQGLAQRIALPNFEVVFDEDKPIQMRVGPDVLHNFNTVIPINNLDKCQDIAEQRIDMLRAANTMLAKCSASELEKINLNDVNTLLSFQLLCIPHSLMLGTFIGTSFDFVANKLHDAISADAAQHFCQHFFIPFMENLKISEGVGPENLSRAIKIACVHFVESGLNAHDRTIVAEFSQMSSQRIETLWQERNDQMWEAWYQTPIAMELPERFSATFKSVFVYDMNQSLNGANWAGDMALVYAAAYEAAYQAGEQAITQDDIETAEKYMHIQQLCTNALHEIQESAERNAKPVNQKCEPETPTSTETSPNGTDEQDGTDAPDNR